MAIAKKINNTPITIKAIFIMFVIVEFPDFWTLDTLLTVEELFEEFDVVFDDCFCVPELDEVFWLVLLEELLEELLEFLVVEFSVKFKSIP